MNKQDRLIRETIELLEDVRAEVQGDLEDSVVHQLDEAILELETITEENSQENFKKALKLLGEAIKWLPPVVSMLVDLFGN